MGGGLDLLERVHEAELGYGQARLPGTRPHRRLVAPGPGERRVVARQTEQTGDLIGPVDARLHRGDDGPDVDAQLYDLAHHLVRVREVEREVVVGVVARDVGAETEGVDRGDGESQVAGGGLVP